jgi:hypothetical protein
MDEGDVVVSLDQLAGGPLLDHLAVGASIPAFIDHYSLPCSA